MKRSIILSMAVCIMLCLLGSSASAGLVKNGDAESVTLFANWYHSGGAYIAADNGPSLAGSSCFAVPTGNDIRTVKFNVTPSEILTLTYDYKSTSGTTGQIYCLLRYWDVSSGFLGQSGGAISATGGVWDTMEVVDSVVPAGAVTADIAIFTNGFAGEFRFDNVMIDGEINGEIDLVYYLTKPKYADGYTYDAKDSAGNGMACVSVIDLVGQTDKYAAVYHSAYAAGTGWRYKINYATSNDLINWTYRGMLVDNADMPKIVTAANGDWIVMVHEQWMNEGSSGQSQSPSRIGFKLFYDSSELWDGTTNDTWTAPQYNTQYGLDGTPNFYDCYMDYIDGHWVIEGQVGFHFWDGTRDVNATATIGEVFSGAGTDWWSPSTTTAYNNDLISMGVTGNIGQRESIVTSDGRYNVQEGNIGTPASSWDKWRIWLYDYSETTVYPTGAGTFTQLSPETHSGSISFGNPAVSTVADPDGTGECMVISYFIFAEGAAPGEAGSLIYYFDGLEEVVDIDPPTPNPATFATAPYATSSSSIAMVATTGTDASGPVEYYFACTAGGGNDSGWQTSSSYTDTGLSASTQYTYTVQMRDSLDNTGTASSGASATTDAPADTDPPTPNPASFATAPYATSSSSIAMVATTGSDASGPVEYYFACTAGGGNDSGWQTSTSYTDSGLTASTQYTYTVQMRDSLSNTGTASSGASATTDAASGPVVVFADNFESATDWTNNWSAYGAWNRVTTRKHDGSYSAEIDGSVTDSALVSTSIDVTGKSSATVTFWWYIESGLDTGEYLAFDTDTGSGWVQKADIQGNVDTENVWASESIVVDVSGTSSLQIRFRGKISKSNEDAYLDQVEVSAE